MKRALPALVTVTAVLVLSGCGLANETPCREIEAAYNEANLRDKLNMTKPSGQEYGPALARLASVAETQAEKAHGDVKEHLWGFVNGHTRYEQADGDWRDFVDARIQVDEARDGLVEACKGSGYPIQLEPSEPRPTR